MVDIFGIDRGRIQKLKVPFKASEQTTLLEFSEDDMTTKSRINGIVDSLINGWGLRFDKGTVVRHVYGTKYLKDNMNDSLIIEEVQASEIPTPRTIEGAFGVNLSSAYRVIRELKARLNLYSVNRQLRAQRGDAVTKHWRQARIRQVTLTRFFLMWQRVENKERRISKRGH